MIVLFVCLFVFCHQTISNLSAIHRDSRRDVRYTDKFYFVCTQLLKALLRSTMLSLMTESIEGVMEEVFTAMEHIKKRNNPLLSVVHFFDVK